jgi:hypothetical protein
LAAGGGEVGGREVGSGSPGFAVDDKDLSDLMASIDKLAH